MALVHSGPKGHLQGEGHVRTRGKEAVCRARREASGKPALLTWSSSSSAPGPKDKTLSQPQGCSVLLWTPEQTGQFCTWKFGRFLTRNGDHKLQDHSDYSRLHNLVLEMGLK